MTVLNWTYNAKPRTHALAQGEHARADRRVLQSQSFSQSYGSVLPTSLIYMSRIPQRILTLETGCGDQVRAQRTPFPHAQRGACVPGTRASLHGPTLEPGFDRVLSATPKKLSKRVSRTSSWKQRKYLSMLVCVRQAPAGFRLPIIL